MSVTAAAPTVTAGSPTPALQVRCHSSFEFLAALKVLKPTLRHLKASGLAALLIDNIAAYYYLDRAARGAAAAGLGPVGVGGAGSIVSLLLPQGQGLLPPATDITLEGAPLSLWRVHAAAAADLRALQQEFRLPIIATKHALLGGC